MTGDQADFTARLRGLLPTNWFAVTGVDEDPQTPVLDGPLGGAAATWAWLYSIYLYVVTQTRIATATGRILDSISSDFFALNLPRLPAEGDAGFRARILREMFRVRGTKAAVIAVVTDLTGRAPTILEPGRTTDTSGYNATNRGYGAVGTVYGSMAMPFQFFVNAFRPTGGGLAGVAGYYTGSGRGAGGYGVGAVEYTDPAMIEAQVSDAAIYDAINLTRQGASIACVKISD